MPRRGVRAVHVDQACAREDGDVRCAEDGVGEMRCDGGAEEDEEDCEEGGAEEEGEG